MLCLSVRDRLLFPHSSRKVMLLVRPACLLSEELCAALSELFTKLSSRQVSELVFFRL